MKNPNKKWLLTSVPPMWPKKCMWAISDPPSSVTVFAEFSVFFQKLSIIKEYLGYEVKRTNHIGDWGTQFGMLIQYASEEFPDYMN